MPSGERTTFMYFATMKTMLAAETAANPPISQKLKESPCGCFRKPKIRAPRMRARLSPYLIIRNLFVSILRPKAIPDLPDNGIPAAPERRGARDGQVAGLVLM